MAPGNDWCGARRGASVWHFTANGGGNTSQGVTARRYKWLTMTSSKGSTAEERARANCFSRRAQIGGHTAENQRISFEQGGTELRVGDRNKKKGKTKETEPSPDTKVEAG